MMDSLDPEHLYEFLRRYCHDDILEAAELQRPSVTISIKDLLKFDPDLADALLDMPTTVTGPLETAVRSYDIPMEADMTRVVVRYQDVPDTHHVPINDIRAEHIGKLIAVPGMIRAASEVRPQIVRAVFECQRCGHVFSIPQGGRRFVEPGQCRNDECRRGGPFRLLKDRSDWVDAQALRLQSLHTDLDSGETPQTIDVYVDEDLTALAYPGDEVLVVGSLASVQRRLREAYSTMFDVHLRSKGMALKNKDTALVTITPDEEAYIRQLARGGDALERAAQSVVPYIHGHTEIKESITLQMFSAPQLRRPDGTTVRGDIHILLCGDPGVSKSQMLRRVAKIIPRSIYTSGKSTTGVGLTAAAVKSDSGQWTVEGGALVLADGGVACIDEIDKIPKEDIGSIHEALEHQTVSFMKAGINAILRCRCPVLAACNPKHERFDLHEPIPSQIGVSPTLLSRFDLTFAMIDDLGADVSEETAKYIMQSYGAPGPSTDRSAPLSEDLVRKWVHLSKREVPSVQLTSDTQQLLTAFYVGLRSDARTRGGTTVPITVRQLEGMIRLSQASARLRLRSETDDLDADIAIRLMTKSMDQTSIDPETGFHDQGIIETGQTRTQYDRINRICEIIETLESQNGSPPSEDEVIKEAVDAGIGEERARKIIDRCLQGKSLYAPKFGLLSVVK